VAVVQAVLPDKTALWVLVAVVAVAEVVTVRLVVMAAPAL
jgi:hypothetical protein